MTADPRLGLETHSVTVRYGTTIAVDEASVHVPRGTVLALLGPSGSGKSSLLRAISGLEPVVHGDITWQGRSITSVPIHQRSFGLMFQDGQLFPHRNVAGNVAYGLRRLPRSQRNEVVKDALALVGMENYADRAVDSLSGGQSQRVALARAIAPKPDVLLLDEPLSALDRSLRERLSDEVRQILHNQQMTCVYVTHDQEEAFTVADRIAVMINGQVAACDSPQNLWANPRRADVAAFLGHSVVTLPDGSQRGVPVESTRLAHVSLPLPLPSYEANASYADSLTASGIVRSLRPGRGTATCTVEVQQINGLAAKPTLLKARVDVGNASQIHVGNEVAVVIDVTHTSEVTA